MKMKYWKDVENQKTDGITLIALVVTIIVLLILAGITISLVIGQNGIITKANQAKVKQEKAQIYESLKLKILDKEIEQNITEDDSTDYSNWLKENGWIDSNRKVNVEKVVGKKLSTGNGTEKDIYKVEIEGEDLVLNYYNKENEKEAIGPIIKEESLEPTSPDYFDFTPETGEIALKDGMSYYRSNELSPITTIVIPLEIEGVPVTTIGNHYMREEYHHTQGFNASNIRKIIIPEGITNIVEAQYEGAFSGAGIQQITIPSTIKKIGEYAFGRCENLERVILKEGVEEIGIRAFAYCNNLKEISLPSTLKVINSEAFSENDKLSSIEIRNTVTTIGGNAFYKMKCVIYPKGTSVETGNLDYGARIIIDENVKDYVTIDDCIYSADKTTLYYVPMDKTEVTIPEGVTTIGKYAFYNCTELRTITIPNSVTVIENSAFNNCTSLNKLELSEGITNVESLIIEDCYNLKEIIIPSTVTSINNSAFKYSYLEKITIKAGSTLTVPSNKWGANNATVVKE